MSPWFRTAESADVEGIVELMRRYYREASYPFHQDAARGAVVALLENNQLGWLWVIAIDEKLVGYLAVTLGFSLEYLGRDAFVDELYLVPEARRRGLGAKALALAERTCRRADVKALHLEVERVNSDARRLYERSGFATHDRELMTKFLEPGEV